MSAIRGSESVTNAVLSTPFTDFALPFLCFECGCPILEVKEEDVIGPNANCDDGADEADEDTDNILSEINVGTKTLGRRNYFFAQ